MMPSSVSVPAGETPAQVHDYLLVLRGAERTFAAMADCWRDAPIATLLYDKAGTSSRFADRRVHTSPLQRLGASQDTFRRMLPLYPMAAERLPVRDHRLVISSSSAFAHGVRPDPGAVHVCYCHSPFRYAWHERATALQEAPRAASGLLRHVLERNRRWDLKASRGVTRYVANSAITQQRIAEFWGRDSVVIHRPVDVDRFDRAESEDWFLVVGEVVRHKRVRIALQAARRAGRRIKVAGSGPDLADLQREFGDAEFLGRVSDEQLTDLYPRARALVMANVEEFGIAGVESQAAGRPVLAADGGGARETVVDGETGHLVPVDDVEALAEAMADADLDGFASERIMANAQRFSVERFQETLRHEVDRAVAASPAPA